MEEKKTFGTRIEAFFAGKGFYAVLFLCIAVIGVSVWSILAGGAESALTNSVSMSVASLDDDVIATGNTAPVSVTEPPAATVPSVEPTPAAAEAAPAEQTSAVEPAVPTAAEVQEYYIWPVVGEIDAAYSVSALVWNPTMQDWRTHDGIDIACDLGTQVKAAANGQITRIYEDDLYGTTVVMTHQNELQSIYSNLAATPAVAVGDHVGVGQVIGAVGDTALGEAGQVCHLHFAMLLDGESVDPTGYMP